MREHDWEKEEPEAPKQRRGFFDRLWGFMGFVAEEVEEEEAAAAEEPVMDHRRREKPRVVSLSNAQRQFRVVVFEPGAFEEVQGIVDQLKSNRPVIINLEETDKTLARRIVDFMSGAVYAIGGGMQKVSMTIFLFTPPGVEISLGPRAEPREHMSFFNFKD